ncbi:2-keto-3-deoxy-L-rhamnonate aldolase [soil metagenome]
MRPSRIVKKLRENQPVLLTTLHLMDASLFELASLMGFDGIWIDMEHHSHSVETAATMMRAARVGSSDILARPAKGEFMRLGRLLEAGAQGILYPRCDNAKEAAEVVRWAKFPPLGQRGLDTGNADAPYCTMPIDKYVKEANDQTFIIVQVEDPAAITHVEEMLAVPGVDGIMIGPGDFSSLAGLPGQVKHPSILAAAARVAEAARRTGKHWGIPVASVEDAAKYLEMGARFLPHHSDIMIVKQGWERMQQAFAPLGFSFNNRLPVQG